MLSFYASAGLQTDGTVSSDASAGLQTDGTIVCGQSETGIGGLATRHRLNRPPKLISQSHFDLKSASFGWARRAFEKNVPFIAGLGAHRSPPSRRPLSGLGALESATAAQSAIYATDPRTYPIQHFHLKNNY
jgi:hypothetical protein